MTPIKSGILTLISSLGFIDSVLLYSDNAPVWFNPFIGMLLITSLPFAGAMVIAFGVNITPLNQKANKQKPSNEV